MRIQTLSELFEIVNEVMFHKYNILGYSVTLYDFIFYELLIVVVVGALFFIFSQN